MSALNNSVRLTGYLGSAPEIKLTESQKKFARLNLATNNYRKDENGERVTETTWHKLVLWERQADLAEQYLSKGSKVSIEGRLTNRFYTDADGVKRSYYEVVVNEFDFLKPNQN